MSWGILMPIGAIIARYMRVFKSADPAWFYLHVACQCSAYIVGVAGWGTGLKLGSDSKGITYHSHRDIGIALFCLATLQVSPFSASLLHHTLFIINLSRTFYCQHASIHFHRFRDISYTSFDDSIKMCLEVVEDGNDSVI